MPVPKNTGSHRMRRSPSAANAATRATNGRRLRRGAAPGALAQETRLALFRLLVTCGPAGLAAGAIAERLGVAPSSLSFHLQLLVHAGLITQRRLSRNLIYSA